MLIKKCVHDKWKGYYNLFNSYFDKKKASLHKMSYFPESYSHNKNKIKVELGLYNYATISDLKEATCINTAKCAKKVDLANLNQVLMI